MARREKTSTKLRAERDSKSSRAGGRLARWVYRPRVLLLLAAIGAVFLLKPYVSRWLPDLANKAVYRYTMTEMRLTPPNRWVPADLVREVIESAGLPDEYSLLDEGVVSEVAAALDQHPWVAEVVEVRLSRETGIEAELEYRIPVLMVETPRGVYPVDRESVLLPPTDFAVADVKRFPLLRQTASMPAGSSGEPWGDQVVLGAARLASELAPDQQMSEYWDRFELTAIEAPGNRSDDVPLEEVSYELVTSGGSRIVWGCPPGADHLEPTVQQKLARLEDYLATHGGFESARGPNRIDIRQFDTIEVISLQPATPQLR